MKKSEMSGKAFLNGLNCAQSILTTFGPELDLEKGICMKIAAPFGGGLAKNQKVCGAVSGALMVLGLKYGKAVNITGDDKKCTFPIANEFIKKFKEKHQSVDCIDILGADMHTPEGQKIINQQNLYQTKCVKFVEDAAEILENLLNE